MTHLNLRAVTTAQWGATYQAEPMQVVITVPELPPSLNEWSRQHWRARWDRVKQYTSVFIALRGAYRLPTFERARVQMVYYFRDRRRRDPDNYTPKAILDGLRHAGIIAEDHAGVLQLPQPRFEVDKAVPRTEIYIGPWIE